MSSLSGREWLDAQVGVIGSVLISPELAPRVIAETAAEDYSGDCRGIFNAMVGLMQEQKPVDAMTIRNRLGPASETVIREIMQATPTAANIDAYIADCKDRSRLLRMQQLAMEIISADSLKDTAAALGKMNALQVEDAHRISSAQDIANRFIDRHNGTRPREFIDWGFEAVNEYLDVTAGKYVVLGGYPSDGKSALMLQMAKNQSAKLRVGIFSLETDDDTIGDRLLSHTAKIGLKGIIRDQIPREDWQRLTAACSDIFGHSLEVIDAARMKASEISAVTIAQNYQIIYVDYLQLIEPDNPREIRSEQVASISRQLQQLAKRQKVTVIALSQLSRPEPGKNGYIPAPTLRSFRESGQIEQDADVALLLYRQDNTDPQSDRTLMIAKNKEGRANIGITLKFDGSIQTFSRPTHAEIRRIANRAKQEATGQLNFSELEDASPETQEALAQGMESVRER